AGANGTGGAMPVALTVSAGATAEIVTSNATLESASLGSACNVDFRADFKDVGGDLLTQGMGGEVVGAEFREMAQFQRAGGLEVPGFGLAEFLCVFEPDLDGGIAIAFGGTQVRYVARADEDRGGTTQAPLVIEELDGAQLAAEKSFDSHVVTA